MLETLLVVLCPEYLQGWHQQQVGTVLFVPVFGLYHFRTVEKIWEFSDNPDTILISSCTTVEVMSDGELVRGSDCINGTKMPNTFFEEYTNFTHLMKVFLKAI